MDRYGRFLARSLWPAWETALRGRATPRLLDYLNETQWMSWDELHAVQSGALRRLLVHARDNVPWYRNIFESRGLSASAIKSRDDLPKLPILTREQALENGAARTSLVPPFPTISKSTSGSMGVPLSFAYDSRSDQWRNAIRLRSYAWCGYPLGARAMHYWARPPVPPPLSKRVKVALDRGLKRELYVDCTPRSDDAMAEVVARIRRYRPEVIVAFSQAAAALARHVNRTGARTWGDIAVICGAERLHDGDRRALERAFGPHVYETYGSREVMLMACECPAHQGLHEMSENIIVELVVRDEGGERPARPGEIGEVVITDLHNYGMPFIRYANGDRAAAEEPVPCSCGRTMPRLGAIEGRVTETLRDAAGNEVSGLVFNLVFVDIADVSRQFQVIQHPDRAITLKLVPGPGLSAEHLERIEKQCADYLPGIALTIDIVTEIPLTAAGKRKVVVVEEAPAAAIQTDPLPATGSAPATNVLVPNQPKESHPS